MRTNKVGSIAIKSFALLVALATAFLTLSQPAVSQQNMPLDAATPHPGVIPTNMIVSNMVPANMIQTKMVPANMAPIEQYLMDRTAEIALARSAAPESISRDAEVMVLGRQSFETAVQGKNGFVCIVERSWTSAADAEFWNQKVRTPICFNAAAAHSIFLRNLKRTDLILAGRTQAQTDETIFAAVDKKELPAMEPGAMCYMMSKQGYGGDTVKHWPPHLMFYFSQTDATAWGANLRGSPVVAMSDAREHLTEFVIGVQRWSDGTENREER